MNYWKLAEILGALKVGMISKDVAFEDFLRVCKDVEEVDEYLGGTNLSEEFIDWCELTFMYREPAHGNPVTFEKIVAFMRRHNLDGFRVSPSLRKLLRE